MKEIILDSREYTEGAEFPETRMGEESIIEVKIINPYESTIGILPIPEDQDIEVLFCPKTLEAKSSAVIKLKYAPSRTRTESLKGKMVEFKIAL